MEEETGPVIIDTDNLGMTQALRKGEETCTAPNYG